MRILYKAFLHKRGEEPHSVGTFSDKGLALNFAREWVSTLNDMPDATPYKYDVLRESWYNGYAEYFLTSDLYEDDSSVSRINDTSDLASLKFVRDRSAVGVSNGL